MKTQKVDILLEGKQEAINDYVKDLEKLTQKHGRKLRIAVDYPKESEAK